MNRVRKQVVEVTDLFTLESWDFSASTVTTDEAGTTVDEETNGVSLLTIPSLDDLDFSKENNTDKGSSVHVSVSGMIFAVDAHIFKRLEPLPWQLASKEGNKVAASYRPIHARDNNCHAFFSLETSPVLFEMLLNFLMFGTLPDVLDLCDIEELEPLAALLNQEELQHHLEKKMHRGSYRLRRQQNLDSFKHRKKTKKKEKSSFNGNIINKVSTTTPTNNNNSNDRPTSGATLFKKPTGESQSIPGSFSNDQPKHNSTSVGSSSKDATTALPFAFRRMHAALENRRLTQQTRKKMTHADHCAMSDQLF